jgi:Polyketide cyclase / dehydrase and lipid transport
MRQVRVYRMIRASPHSLFQLLADPRNHVEVDGSGMLRGNSVGPHELTLGDTFTMSMSQAGKAYRSLNTVVEFEPDRRITWRSTGTWCGRIVIGGQRWRYVLHPSPDGITTLVEHAYVWGYARMPLLTIWLPGFPHRMQPAMERSLANLAALAAQRQRPGPPIFAVRENRS